MTTSPRTIRFDTDLYAEVKAISKRPFTASYHIQEATRQYLDREFVDKPIAKNKDAPVIKMPAPRDDNNGFEIVWAAYGKKGNKKTSLSKFKRLNVNDKAALIISLEAYINSTPDKQYRKNFETYINQECWNDEVATNEPNQPGQYKASPKLTPTERVQANRAKAEAGRRGQGVGFLGDDDKKLSSHMDVSRGRVSDTTLDPTIGITYAGTGDQGA